MDNTSNILSLILKIDRAKVNLEEKEKLMKDNKNFNEILYNKNLKIIEILDESPQNTQIFLFCLPPFVVSKLTSVSQIYQSLKAYPICQFPHRV